MTAMRLILERFEREDAVVLQQHQRLPRQFQRQLPVFGRVVLVDGDLEYGNLSAGSNNPSRKRVHKV